jgi:hypothetical protein
LYEGAFLKARLSFPEVCAEWVKPPKLCGEALGGPMTFSLSHFTFFMAHFPEYPKEYPLLPPQMKFISEMWHPNSKLN